MNQCSRCQSTRVATVSAKCSDAFWISLNGADHDGYVRPEFGIGDDDYVEFDYCLDCGQIQGTFPLAPTKLDR